jgi:hypothetical protein
MTTAGTYRRKDESGATRRLACMRPISGSSEGCLKERVYGSTDIGMPRVRSHWGEGQARDRVPGRVRPLPGCLRKYSHQRRAGPGGCGHGCGITSWCRRGSRRVGLKEEIEKEGLPVRQILWMPAGELQRQGVQARDGPSTTLILFHWQTGDHERGDGRQLSRRNL